eukprot:8127986-Pyramimonas_sp.AAC.1
MAVASSSSAEPQTMSGAASPCQVLRGLELAQHLLHQAEKLAGSADVVLALRDLPKDGNSVGELLLLDDRADLFQRLTMLLL